MVVAHVGILSFNSCFPSMYHFPRLRFTKSRPFSVVAMSEDPIREWILSEGKVTPITRISSVDGGCINLANGYDTDAGFFFVKTNRLDPYQQGEHTSSWNLWNLAHLEAISLSLGRKLAEMHKAGNRKKALDLMLIIQLEGKRLVENMAPLFENIAIEPCLHHGDLWSGNISSDKNGEPVILDPACYYGHNEAEFGISWYAGFGGFFYNACFEVMPKQPGFGKRRDLYLYHYLNHHNLFGSGYRSSAMSIIDDCLRLLNV